MRVVEPGHMYACKTLDFDEAEIYLQFVKRIGAKYPGNVPPPYGGTTIQEVCRVLIDRLKYVDEQQFAFENFHAIALLRQIILLMEQRASRVGDYEISAVSAGIEHLETCREHLHIQCGKCQKVERHLTIVKDESHER